jgi:hypothetical protein
MNDLTVPNLDRRRFIRQFTVTGLTLGMAGGAARAFAVPHATRKCDFLGRSTKARPMISHFCAKADTVV